MPYTQSVTPSMFLYVHISTIDHQRCNRKERRGNHIDGLGLGREDVGGEERVDKSVRGVREIVKDGKD